MCGGRGRPILMHSVPACNLTPLLPCHCAREIGAGRPLGPAIGPSLPYLPSSPLAPITCSHPHDLSPGARAGQPPRPPPFLHPHRLPLPPPPLPPHGLRPGARAGRRPGPVRGLVQVHHTNGAFQVRRRGSCLGRSCLRTSPYFRPYSSPIYLPRETAASRPQARPLAKLISPPSAPGPPPG